MPRLLWREQKFWSVGSIVRYTSLDFSLMETRKEIYEDVVLWSVLSTGQAQRTETKPTIWQRFLDDVCYLCDTKHGGKSVVSIAVSQWSDRQYFFISANGNLRKAANQLHLVLGELYQIKHKSDVELERTKERLLDIGVRSSSMKVRNYMRELRSHIRSAELLDIVRDGKRFRITEEHVLILFQVGSR